MVVVCASELGPRGHWCDLGVSAFDVGGNNVLMCGQVGDFAVSASHRTLGPAVLLQRATFDPVNNGELAFGYDCLPHQAGMSTLPRLGIRPNCKVHRYAFPLRVDAPFRKRLGAASVVPAAAGNP